MAATMIEVAFVYEDTKFSLILQKEAVTKLYEDSEYMKSFFTELRQHTSLWSEMGLPPDVDVDKIRLAKTNAALIYQGKNIYVIPRSQEVITRPIEAEMRTIEAEVRTVEAEVRTIEAEVQPVEAEVRLVEGEIVEQTGKALNVWTDSMIKLLISTRLEMNDQFSLSIPKKVLWTRVAQIMNEKGYLVTPDGCDVKWRNLLITYRKNKAKARESGEAAVVWPYYSVLNEGLSQIAKTSLQARTLMASLPSDPNEDLDRDTMSPLSDRSARSTSASPVHGSRTALLSPSTSTLKNARKVKRQRGAATADDEDPPAWLVRYMKKSEEANRRREAIEERRWTALAKREDHKMQLEEKKLQAMYALIEVLKK